MAEATKKIVVTGIAGVLGRLVAQRLHRMGTHHVVGIDRRPITRLPKDIEHLQVDLRSRRTREVFRSVPVADRQAAYALGATRWEMIKQAVLPRSRGGVVGATMLGLGRALGETIVVALLIGSSPRISASIFKPGGSIAGLIANSWGEATGLSVSALVGAGVVLFVITIIVNMIARAMVWRFRNA